MRRTLYRSLLRELWPGPALVTEPLAPELFGSSRTAPLKGLRERLLICAQAHGGLDLNLPDALPAGEDGRGIALDRVTRASLLRRAFLAGAKGEGELEAVSHGLQLIAGLNSRARSTCVTEHRDVRVEITAQRAPPGHYLDDGHSFLYRVRVTNLAGVERGITLLGRHWLFRNAEGDPHMVVPKFGEGVLGEQPMVLGDAGMVFEYMSGCSLGTPTGSMEGAFLFEESFEGGSPRERFEVELPQLPLTSRVACASGNRVEDVLQALF